MEILLTRGEFLALAAMARADGIIGLNADDLLPATPEARQQLYQAGESRLQQRDLMRVNAAGEAVLEQDLLRQVQTVTEPQSALVVVRTTPGIGAQLFLFYGRDGNHVEQTLPDTETHRLADIGNAQATRERLQAIFPLPASGAADAGDTSFQADTRALVAAYNLVRSGDPEQAARAVGADKNPDSPNAQWLADIAKMDFGGTLAMVKVTPGETNGARELAVHRAGERAWLMWNAGDGNSVVGRVDAATFAAVLDAALSALESG